MNLKKYFELSRFWLLLKIEISRSRKGLLMALTIIFGFLFIVGFLLAPILDPDLKIYEYTQGYTFMLLAGGFVLSSLAYRDLGNSLKRYNYLTLPVSAFEKFLSMWLLTSVGWILLFTLIYSVYSLIATPIGRLLFDDLTYVPFDPFGQTAIESMKFYFVLQGIFLVGATHFRGYALPKTLLTLVIFAAVCGGIIYLIMNDMFNIDMPSGTCPFADMSVGQMKIILEWMFWWLLAPLCWLITYMGLKEQEV